MRKNCGEANVKQPRVSYYFVPYSKVNSEKVKSTYCLIQTLHLKKQTFSKGFICGWVKYLSKCP